jgi:hypothetical protein
VAESYLEGTALKVVFERRNESEYTAAVNAVMSYTNVPGDDGKPFDFGQFGLSAILTRYFRVGEFIRHLIDKFRGKK